MEELKKLIDILERKGRTSFSALLNYSDNSSLETKLYHLIKGEIPDKESSVIEKLYGDANKLNAYKMLKVRVKRKLHNQLFFLETENQKIVDELVAAELKCKRTIYLADVLHKLQEVTLAEQQFKKAILIAKEAHLTKYEVDALEQFRMLNSERSYDRRTFLNYADRLKELYSIQELERRVDELYFDVRFSTKLGVNDNLQFLQDLSENLTKIKSYWYISGSNHVFKRYHQLKMYYYEFSGEFAELVNYLRETFLLYNSGKIHPAYFSLTFNKYLLVFGLLRTKQFDEGLKEAETLKNDIEEGSYNWFAHMENYFLLAMHSKDYAKASDILGAILSNKYLSEITSFAQERWFIFYKVLNYITGFTAPYYSKVKLKHVPQDKKGFNVWNLILDFLFVLDKNEPELIEREIVRIRKFVSKYLVSKEDTRTKLFLKLLQVLGSEFTDYKRCIKKGSYLLNKLKQTPTTGIAYAETEIVPYEYLWEHVVLSIESNDKLWKNSENL